MIGHFPALKREIDRSALAAAAGDLEGAWCALERAHILAQPNIGSHLRVHLLMLRLAVKHADRREATGQIYRLLLAPVGALSGRIPVGNTGRANVSAFKPMPVPADLEIIRSDQRDL